jgi:hypothetical protein
VAGLVDGGALSNAVIVALPDDVGVCGEGEHALDRFSVEKLSVLVSRTCSHSSMSDMGRHT